MIACGSSGGVWRSRSSNQYPIRPATRTVPPPDLDLGAPTETAATVPAPTPTPTSVAIPTETSQPDPSASDGTAGGGGADTHPPGTLSADVDTGGDGNRLA
jgi:hypothetical protein